MGRRKWDPKTHPDLLRMDGDRFVYGCAERHSNPDCKQEMVTRDKPLPRSRAWGCSNCYAEWA